MLINEITIDPILHTVESLLCELAPQVITAYESYLRTTLKFTIHARDVYSQEEINDFIYDYTIILHRIEDSNLTTESQPYRIAFAILDYFKQ